jgi:hypothetical protein
LSIKGFNINGNIEKIDYESLENKPISVKNGGNVVINEDGTMTAPVVTGGVGENAVDYLLPIAQKIISGEIKNIQLYGDSITAGVGGTGKTKNGKNYCWASLFEEYMRDTYGITVTNYGGSGSELSYQYQKMKDNISDDTDLVIWLTGTNSRNTMEFWETYTSTPAYNNINNYKG